LDEQSLWKSASEASPESYKPHHHLATLLAAPPFHNLDAAAQQIDRALAILQPLPDQWNLPAVYATAGFVYRAQGDALGPAGGAAWYRKALEALLVGQRVDAAWYQGLLNRNRSEGHTVAPAGWSPLYLELGRTYRNLGQYPQALEAFAHGRLIDPQTQFFEEMAVTYRAMGDAGKAAVTLLEGITMGSGDQPRLASEVMELYRQTAPDSCALAGGSLNFGCPLVRGQLCEAARNVVLLDGQMYRQRDAATVRDGAIQSLGCPAEMFR
jgi:tetratricopeptide (TPR) repeat protein